MRAVFPWFARGDAPVGAHLVRFALLGACAYVGAEAVCPKRLGDPLGHGCLPSRRMRQGADVAGAHGLTFALLLANEAALAAAGALLRTGDGFTERCRRVLGPAAALPAVALRLAGYGALRLRPLGAPSARPVRVALVQADLDRCGRLRTEVGSFEAVGRILDLHFAMSAGALARGDADVPVWPETGDPTTLAAPRTATRSTPRSSSNRRRSDGSSSTSIARHRGFRRSNAYPRGSISPGCA